MAAGFCVRRHKNSNGRQTIECVTNIAFPNNHKQAKWFIVAVSALDIAFPMNIPLSVFEVQTNSLVIPNKQITFSEMNAKMNFT